MENPCAGEGVGEVRRVLFQDDISRIELCACGTCHVHLGAVTLRLPLEGVKRVGEALRTAVAAAGPSLKDGRWDWAKFLGGSSEPKEEGI